MKLYQYAILWHPTEYQRDEEGKRDKVLQGITEVLAKDEKSALLLAARAIPTEYTAQLDQVEVAIRPF